MDPRRPRWRQNLLAPREHSLTVVPPFVGVMSGTSMDAADAVVIDLTETAPRLIAQSHSDWPTTLRERLQALAAG